MLLFNHFKESYPRCGLNDKAVVGLGQEKIIPPAQEVVQRFGVDDIRRNEVVLVRFGRHHPQHPTEEAYHPSIPKN